MPLTGYLKIDDIPGESQRVDHEGEIDISDITWGIDRPDRSPAVRGGRARSRAAVADLVCRKVYDASSPYLARAALDGRSFDEAVVTIRRDSGDAHLDYLTLSLRDVVVSSYAILGTDTPASGDLLHETIGLRAERVTVLYVVQADDHSAGDEHEVELDVAGRG